MGIGIRVEGKNMGNHAGVIVSLRCGPCACLAMLFARLGGEMSWVHMSSFCWCLCGL